MKITVRPNSKGCTITVNLDFEPNHRLRSAIVTHAMTGYDDTDFTFKWLGDTLVVTYTYKLPTKTTARRRQHIQTGVKILLESNLSNKPKHA